MNNCKSLSQKQFQINIGEFIPIRRHHSKRNVMSSILCFCRTIQHEVYTNEEMSSFDEIKNLYQTLKTEWNKRKPDFKQCYTILLQIKVRKSLIVLFEIVKSLRYSKKFNSLKRVFKILILHHCMN